MTREQLNTHINSLMASNSDITAVEMRQMLNYLADFADANGGAGNTDVFTELPGDLWHGTNESTKRFTALTGNRAIVTTDYPDSYVAMLRITANNNYTLTHNGTNITNRLNKTGNTLVGIVHIGGGVFEYDSNLIGAIPDGDTGQNGELTAVTILEDSFNRSAGMLATPDFGPAYIQAGGAVYTNGTHAYGSTGGDTVKVDTGVTDNFDIIIGLGNVVASTTLDTLYLVFLTNEANTGLLGVNILLPLNEMTYRNTEAVTTTEGLDGFYSNDILRIKVRGNNFQILRNAVQISQIQVHDRDATQTYFVMYFANTVNTIDSLKIIKYI